MHNHIPRTDCPVVVLLLIAYTNCPLHIYIYIYFYQFRRLLFRFIAEITKRVNFPMKIERRKFHNSSISSLRLDFLIYS